MRTLSIRQPWAWLIVHGHKDVENREWATQYRGPLLIHASKTLAKAEYLRQRAEIEQAFGITVPALDAVPLGGIVGVVQLADCAAHSDSPWYTGAVAWVLRQPMQLPFAPCKGGLGLFHTRLDTLGPAAGMLAQGAAS